MFAPSLKQATGHTLTQSVYLHLMQGSVTVKVIVHISSVALSVRGALVTGDQFAV